MDKRKESKRNEAVEALRAELEGRSEEVTMPPEPFVAHGGKVPTTPPPK